MSSTINLTPGDWYQLRYRQQGGNGQWYQYSMTAQVLAIRNDYGKRTAVLNLRPLAGTTELDMVNVLEASRTPLADPMLPKPVPRGKR